MVGETPTGPAAHPRSRGENTGGGRRARRCWGSSPLTRGKPEVVRGPYCASGLIPAHAGKTPRAVTRLRALSAHPRSRGENQQPFDLGAESRGSSPLTRGKPRSTIWATIASGLIPAHAGKTRGCYPVASAPAAHPRSRGENVFIIVVVATLTGSSPLTRGKPLGDVAPGLAGRLIPAHAGKTDPTACIRRTLGAHPRSRGENYTDTMSPASAAGSSPLTRGKLGDPAGPSRRRGLIPAHAGKTETRGCTHHVQAAHPRSRGENTAIARTVTDTMGSSPLTRGKLADRRITRGEGRLIPAHAGKTAM